MSRNIQAASGRDAPTRKAMNSADTVGEQRTERRELTLLVRAYCHLCDEMRAAVAPIAAAAGIALREVDVDGDPGLDLRWGERVPVLLAGERELCHYRLDARALASFLAAGA